MEWLVYIFIGMLFVNLIFNICIASFLVHLCETIKKIYQNLVTQSGESGLVDVENDPRLLQYHWGPFDRKK